ncbi:hypothetical protein D3C73_953350 [compost metagenome]
MRAISNTLVLEFCFTRCTNITPTSTCGDDDGFTFQNSAIFQFNLNQILLLQAFYTLCLHDVNAVFLGMLFKACCELRTFCVFHTNKVLDPQRIINLSAEAFGNNTCTNPFACRINRCTCPRRATADNQYIVRLFICKLRSV